MISRRATSATAPALLNAVGLSAHGIGLLAHHVPEQLGQRRPARTERPHRSGGQRGPQHALVVGARRRARPRSGRRRATPPGRRAVRRPSPAAPPAPRSRAARRRRPAARRPGRPRPSVHCGQCRPGRRAARPDRAGGWRRAPGCPAPPSPAAPALITSTATGSSPENGSSSTRICGSCTSEAASWTRCWLPRLSFCTSSSRRPATPSRSVHRSHRRLGRGRRHPVQPGQVDELLGHLHLRVEPALLGHVPDLPAGREGQRLARPADLAGSPAASTPRIDPHRGGLAGAVAADESEQLTRAHVEREVPQSDHVAVGLRHALDLQPLVRHG